MALLGTRGKGIKGMECPTGKVLVSILADGEDGVDVDLFVVPWRGLGRPMGLSRGWKGLDNRGEKASRLPHSRQPRVVDYFRPFGGEVGSPRTGVYAGLCVWVNGRLA